MSGPPVGRPPGPAPACATGDAAAAPPLPPPPAWLGPALAAFSAALTAPLVVQAGRRRAPPPPPSLVRALRGGGGPGLALYQEQGWARFFGAFHAELPRVAAVLGAGPANDLVAAFLGACPPRAADLGRCADGFSTALLDALGAPPADAPPNPAPPAAVSPAPRSPLGAALRDGLAATPCPAGLLSQAARADEAVRQALRAPFLGIWRPSPADLAALPTAPLRPAPGLRVVRQDWDLTAPPPLGDRPARPRARPTPQWLVVARTADGAALTPVPTAFARLLGLAARAPLPEALALLGAGADPGAAAAWEAAAPGWVTRALESGWWVGLERPR